MTTEGGVLVRVAELLKVDEIRQMSASAKPMLRFVIRVGTEHEEVDLSEVRMDSIDAVTKVLFVAASRVRRRAALLEFIGSAPLGVPAPMDLPMKLLIDPTMPKDSFELLDAESVVRVANCAVDAPKSKPLDRFAAIALEMMEDK